jgi:hypothetical protein
LSEVWLLNFLRSSTKNQHIYDLQTNSANKLGHHWMVSIN